VLTESQYRRAVAISIGLAVLWVVVALLRDGTTFHLAPMLVAAVLPIVVASDNEEGVETSRLALAALAGLAIALLGTLFLAVAGEMTGPSLLPSGGAVAESVIFAIVGAIGGFAIGRLRRRTSATEPLS